MALNSIFIYFSSSFLLTLSLSLSLTYSLSLPFSVSFSFYFLLLLLLRDLISGQISDYWILRSRTCLFVCAAEELKKRAVELQTGKEQQQQQQKQL